MNIFMNIFIIIYYNNYKKYLIKMLKNIFIFMFGNIREKSNNTNTNNNNNFFSNKKLIYNIKSDLNRFNLNNFDKD